MYCVGPIKGYHVCHVRPEGESEVPVRGHMAGEFGPENSKVVKALCGQRKTHGFYVNDMAPDRKS